MAVLGTHSGGRNNADVESIWIESQNELTFVPSRLENFFPNLKVFYFYHTNLKSISSADLQPFSELLWLSVLQGSLISIDGDLFQFSEKIRGIDFNSNQIEHVGHNLATSLEELQYLGFLNNTCINQEAGNRTAILQLNAILPIGCPPLDTPTEIPTVDPPSDCPCLDEIEILNEEIETLRLEIMQQKEIIGQLVEFNKKLKSSLGFLNECEM